MNIIDKLPLLSDKDKDYKDYYIDDIIKKLIEKQETVYISCTLGNNFLSIGFHMSNSRCIYFGNYINVPIEIDKYEIDDYLNNKFSKMKRLYKIDKLLNIVI